MLRHKSSHAFKNNSLVAVYCVCVLVMCVCVGDAGVCVGDFVCCCCVCMCVCVGVVAYSVSDLNVHWPGVYYIVD